LFVPAYAEEVKRETRWKVGKKRAGTTNEKDRRDVEKNLTDRDIVQPVAEKFLRYEGIREFTPAEIPPLV
jgi:hypothetical protein